MKIKTLPHNIHLIICFLLYLQPWIFLKKFHYHIDF